MKYRIFKERRFIKPYKLQIWSGTGEWSDGLKIKSLPARQGLVQVRYFWTKRGALKSIQRDRQAEGIFDE